MSRMKTGQLGAEDQLLMDDESMFAVSDVSEVEEELSLPLLLERVDQIFAPNGPLANCFADYAVREQQVELARSVLSSLYKGEHLLAEAGTGVGKSFAYLVAAALWSLLTDEVVVISTHTVPLQSQLMQKDLPVVAQVMQQIGLGELRYELAKGRGHYICRRRLSNYLRRVQDGDVLHGETAQRLWRDLEKSAAGDRQDFAYPVPGELWHEINGDPEDCHGSFSPYYERCFIQQARRKLFHAHLVVSNHALFFTDFSLRLQEENGILPNYERVIFDEAHHVEEVFSRFFARSVSLAKVEQFFRSLVQRRQTWMEEVFDDQDIQEFRGFEDRMLQQFRLSFDQIGQCIDPGNTGKREQTSRLLTNPLPLSFHGLSQQSEEFCSYLTGISKLRVQDEVQRRGVERLMRSCRGLVEDLEFASQCAGGEDWAHWVEWELKGGQGIGLLFGDSFTLSAQPIQASAYLQEQLFAKVPATLLSATMTAAGRFDFLASRLGVERYNQLVLPAPFDYAKQSLLVVSETAPPPGDPQGKYEEFLVTGLKRVLELTQGRTLVLFTSFQTLQLVVERLQDWLAERQLVPLVHEVGGERERLLQEFTREEHAVLFGCDSFWEGIDLPGELLQCIVITKIPFANLGDPLVQARMRRIESGGGNSFAEYMVPMAIIKLRQGFGRLIRRANDTGSVVLMDSRLLQKAYGKKMLQSLPAARRGRLQEIPRYLAAYKRC